MTLGKLYIKKKKKSFGRVREHRSECVNLQFFFFFDCKIKMRVKKPIKM